MGFEYDPHNKLRHTTHWYETDEHAEWPVSNNAKEELAPAPGDVFDYAAEPERFYFDVETIGALTPREVVQKVNRLSIIPLSLIALSLDLLTERLTGVGRAPEKSWKPCARVNNE